MNTFMNSLASTAWTIVPIILILFLMAVVETLRRANLNVNVLFSFK